MKKKNYLTRRDFLKGAATVAAGAAVLGLQGCADTDQQLAALAYPARQPSAGQPLVGIARHESAEEAVRQAIALTSGLGFISPGDTVLLKPNVNSGDPYPYSTNPEVVAAVTKLAFEHGAAHVFVADTSNPMYLPTVEAMDRAGIYQMAIESGAEVMDLGVEGYTLINPKSAVNWPGGFRVPTLLKQVDHVINLPTCKDHLMANYTMSLKNWMGVIPEAERMYIHTTDFGTRIPELHFGLSPSLTILDATRTDLTGGAMPGLTPNAVTASTGLVVATTDPVACDVTGLAILKHNLKERTDRQEKTAPQISGTENKIVHAITSAVGDSPNAPAPIVTSKSCTSIAALAKNTSNRYLGSFTKKANPAANPHCSIPGRTHASDKLDGSKIHFTAHEQKLWVA
jgi:uncharacterized protein (DUF362 family)